MKKSTNDSERIAQKLIKNGWNHRDDSDRFIRALATAIMEDSQLVNEVYNQMERIESENEDNSKMTELDYLEKMGKV